VHPRTTSDTVLTGDRPNEGLHYSERKDTRQPESGASNVNSGQELAATKAAIRSFARTWTTDLKERKIRVNVVSPGPIDTAGLREPLGDSPEGKQRKQGLAQAVPLGRMGPHGAAWGRMGRADEIAKAVRFLASDDSPGAELFVDGGMGLWCNARAALSKCALLPNTSHSGRFTESETNPAL
jgi:hypothetical protein